jgi:hypothetical protein
MAKSNSKFEAWNSNRKHSWFSNRIESEIFQPDLESKFCKNCINLRTQANNTAKTNSWFQGRHWLPLRASLAFRWPAGPLALHLKLLACRRAKYQCHDHSGLAWRIIYFSDRVSKPDRQAAGAGAGRGRGRPHFLAVAFRDQIMFPFVSVSLSSFAPNRKFRFSVLCEMRISFIDCFSLLCETRTSSLMLISIS